MSLSLRRQKREIVWIGKESLSDTEYLLTNLLHLVGNLQSTHGITLRNMRIEKSVSSSSTSNESWEVELGLSLSKESQERIDGFSYLRLQAILGSTTSQYSLQTVFFAMRPSSNESMSCTLRLLSTPRLSST